MRGKMKRIISTVLLCTLLVSVFCVNALAADNEKIASEISGILRADSSRKR